MRIKLISVGKIKESNLKNLSNDYVKRISRFCPVDVMEIKEEKITSSITKVEILRKEGERIIKIVNYPDLIALDIHGKQFTSEEFAEMLNRYLLKSRKELQFLVGGPLGIDEEILQQSSLRWSLSKLTFPHEVAHIMALEQIYRAFSIMNNTQYHK